MAPFDDSEREVAYGVVRPDDQNNQGVIVVILV